jgi:glyoxylase-like metal-dependent hydrolase (beta-lactamase superfamily II)
VREGRRSLAAPGVSAAATTNGRTASLIYAARTGAGVVVVDLGWSGAGRALDRALRDLGARREDVIAVLLTHSHRDHVGAWRALRAVPFYLGTAELPLLFGERPHAGPGARAADWLLAPRLPRRGEVRVVPVARDTAVVFGADTVRAFATPGHTAGSVSWLVGDVLFVGDAASADVLTGRLRSARALYAESVAESARSLARVRRATAPFRVRLVCTAHARCATPSAEAWRAVAGG